MPIATNAGVVPRMTATAARPTPPARPAIRTSRPAGVRAMPRQLLRQIAPRGRSTGRTETEPRGAARSFVAELTPQEHHGPQILHRDRESQLGHEIATPGEWFDAEPTDEPPGDDHERQRHGDRDEIAGLLLVSPERQVPEPVTRAGDVADDGGQLPDHEHGRDRRRDRTRDVQRMGDRGDGHEHEPHNGADHRTAGRPRGGRSGQSLGRQHASDAADDR